MACSLTSRGKPKDNVAAALNVYDENEENILQREDMQLIIEAVHELYEGINLIQRNISPPSEIDYCFYKIGPSSSVKSFFLSKNNIFSQMNP